MTHLSVLHKLCLFFTTLYPHSADFRTSLVFKAPSGHSPLELLVESAFLAHSTFFFEKEFPLESNVSHSYQKTHEAIQSVFNVIFTMVQHHVMKENSFRLLQALGTVFASFPCYALSKQVTSFQFKIASIIVEHLTGLFQSRSADVTDTYQQVANILAISLSCSLAGSLGRSRARVGVPHCGTP